jgi:ribosomal protein S11
MQNSINFKFKKLQDVSNILQTKVYFLNVRTTLNNFYVTVTNNFGKVILLSSGGMLKLLSSKRNTSYSLELVLIDLLKKLVKLQINCFILRLDFQTIKRKKLISKIIQKFSIKVLAIQLNTLKAFNGVRPSKRRRI